jgi:hypothetical protein
MASVRHRGHRPPGSGAMPGPPGMPQVHPVVIRTLPPLSQPCRPCGVPPLATRPAVHRGQRQPVPLLSNSGGSIRPSGRSPTDGTAPALTCPPRQDRSRCHFLCHPEARMISKTRPGTPPLRQSPWPGAKARGFEPRMGANPNRISSPFRAAKKAPDRPRLTQSAQASRVAPVRRRKPSPSGTGPAVPSPCHHAPRLRS